MTPDEAQALVASQPRWYHRFEIFPGVVTPGVCDPGGVWQQLRMPPDLHGQRVLEIGPADGFFTKQLDLRGADVTAIDYRAKDVYGFAVMEKLHGRTLRYIQANLFDIDALDLGHFDYALCLGLLYHLPDMLRGLWTLRGHLKPEGMLIIETLVCRDHEDAPFARYFPAKTYNNDLTNFWAPNPRCVEMMLADCGFIITDTILAGERAIFHAKSDCNPAAGHKLRRAYYGLR